MGHTCASLPPTEAILLDQMLDLEAAFGIVFRCRYTCTQNRTEHLETLSPDACMWVFADVSASAKHCKMLRVSLCCLQEMGY